MIGMRSWPGMRVTISEQLDPAIFLCRSQDAVLAILSMRAQNLFWFNGEGMEIGDPAILNTNSKRAGSAPLQSLILFLTRLRNIPAKQSSRGHTQAYTSSVIRVGLSRAVSPSRRRT